MTVTIRHSGQSFTSLRYGKYAPVYPIEEYLVRRKHSPAVAARIKRLNPNGKEEGSRPRGWHPQGRAVWAMDVVSVDWFRRNHGSAALRALPRSAFSKTGGKRRAISMVAYQEWLCDN